MASMLRRVPNTSCGGCFLQGSDCLLQAGDDLGHVLLGATRGLLFAGHDCVLLVNGDSPTLPPRFLVQAIEALREPGDRMVLGPASDGGYYLIGLKYPHRQLFTQIAWGTRPSHAARASALTKLGLPRRCFRNGTMSTTSRRCAGYRVNWPAAPRVSRRRSCAGEPSLSQAAPESNL